MAYVPKGAKLIEEEDIAASPTIKGYMPKGAKLIKTRPVPELRADISERPYRAPLTDIDKAGAVVDLVNKEAGYKPTWQERASKAVTKAQPITETIGLPQVTALNAIRGIVSAAEPRSTTGKTILESARRGVLSPESVQPIGASIQQAYPKMPWFLSGTAGTAAEMSVLMGPKGIQALGKTIAQSSAWKGVEKHFASPEDLAKRIMNGESPQELLRNLSASKRQYVTEILKDIQAKVSNRGIAGLLEGPVVKKTPISPDIAKVVDPNISQAVRPSARGVKSQALVESQKNKYRGAVVSIVRNAVNLVLPSGAKLPQDMADFSHAVQTTRQNLYDKWNTLEEQAGKSTPVDLDKIAALIRGKYGKMTQLEGVRAEAAKMAEFLMSQPNKDLKSTVEIIRNLNEQISSNYASSDFGNKAKIYADVLADLRAAVDRTIVSKVGPGWQELRNEYRNLRYVEGDVNKAVLRIAKKVNPGMYDSLAKTVGRSEVIAGIFSANPGLIAKGLTIEGITHLIARAKDPNRKIKNMFDQVSKLVGPKEVAPQDLPLTEGQAKNLYERTRQEPEHVSLRADLSEAQPAIEGPVGPKGLPVPDKPTENLGVITKPGPDRIARINKALEASKKMLPYVQRRGMKNMAADIERRIQDLEQEKAQLEAQAKQDDVLKTSQEIAMEKVGIDEESGMPVFRKKKPKSVGAAGSRGVGYSEDKPGIPIEPPVGETIKLRNVQGQKEDFTRKPGEEITVEPMVRQDGTIARYKVHDGDTVDVPKGVGEDLLNKFKVKGQSKEIGMPEGVEEVVKTSDATRYDRPDLVLPGGKNYREVLIKFKDKNEGRLQDFLKTIEKKYRVKGLADDSMPASRMKKFYKDLRKDEKAEWNTLSSQSVRDRFKSSHWDESNVFAHVRMNDRTTVDGKKVLFVEELQSDWARESRFYEKKYGEFVRSNELVGTDVPKRVPSHPLLKNWQELSLKRVLKEAKEKGYDYISWTTGQQQADRYDLSKQVDRVTYQPDQKRLMIQEKNGGGVTNKSNVESTEIEKYIGKDAAKKLLGTPLVKGSLSGYKFHEINSENLKIGGEWAKNLYDRQVPNILKDLTGGKVENVQLGKVTKKDPDLQQFKKLANKFDRQTITEIEEDELSDLTGRLVERYGLQNENVMDAYEELRTKHLGKQSLSQQAIRISEDTAKKSPLDMLKNKRGGLGEKRPSEMGRGFFIDKNGKTHDVSSDVGSGTNDHVGFLAMSEGAVPSENFGLDKNDIKAIKQVYETGEGSPEAGVAREKIFKSGAIRTVVQNGTLYVDSWERSPEVVNKILKSLNESGVEGIKKVVWTDAKNDMNEEFSFEGFSNYSGKTKTSLGKMRDGIFNKNEGNSGLKMLGLMAGASVAAVASALGIDKKSFSKPETGGETAGDFLQLEKATFLDLQKRYKISDKETFESVKKDPEKYETVAEIYSYDLEKTFGIPVKDQPLWSWRPSWYKLTKNGDPETLPDSKKNIQVPFKTKSGKIQYKSAITVFRQRVRDLNKD